MGKVRSVDLPFYLQKHRRSCRFSVSFGQGLRRLWSSLGQHRCLASCPSRGFSAPASFAWRHSVIVHFQLRVIHTVQRGEEVIVSQWLEADHGLSPGTVREITWTDWIKSCKTSAMIADNTYIFELVTLDVQRTSATPSTYCHVCKGWSFFQA